MTDPVLLPERRGVKTDRPRMIDFGGMLEPPLGGPVQTLLRLGTRHAIDVTLPAMRSEPAGREWAAKLRLAKLYGALMYFRQDGFVPGSPGAPVSDGAGQTGSTLNLRGFRAGYRVRLGQGFSLIHNSRRYLHFAADYAQAAGDGTLALPIFPMLRVVVADGETCEFAKPIIQGNLSGNEVAWNRLTSPYCDFGTITITESE